MPLWQDYEGKAIRVTKERLSHILGHPEMAGQEARVAGTLAAPDAVIQSRSDASVRLYYRSYDETPVGAKLLCGVVKWRSGDAFLLTAYFTDRRKSGAVIWTKD